MMPRVILTSGGLAARRLSGGWLSLLPVAVEATVPGRNGRITLVSDRDGDLEIYTMRADGIRPRHRTNAALEDLLPDWLAS